MPDPSSTASAAISLESAGIRVTLSALRPRLALAALILLTGCTSMQSIEEFGTPENFAKCAAADVVTTTIGLSTNLIHEDNPLTRALFVKALGRVGGYVVPVIGLSVAGYYFFKWLNRPAVTATAAAVTCFSAARNLYLMR